MVHQEVVYLIQHLQHQQYLILEQVYKEVEMNILLIVSIQFQDIASLEVIVVMGAHRVLQDLDFNLILFYLKKQQLQNLGDCLIVQEPQLKDYFLI